MFAFITTLPHFTAVPRPVKTILHLHRHRPIPVRPRRHPTATLDDPKSSSAPPIPSSITPSADPSQPSLPTVTPAFTPGLAANSAPLDIRVLLGELLSTFIFVHLSLCAAASSPTIPGPFLNSAIIASVAAAFIPVSGAHLNPAVTLALLLTRRVPLSRAALFIVVQCLASTLAALSVRALGLALFPPTINPVGTLALARAFVSEMFPMFVIVCIVFLTAVATPQEGGVGNERAPLYIGLAVLACATAFPTAVFNPARVFGPAIVDGILQNHWLFWIPPCVGASLAGLLCEHAFLAPAVGRPPNSWLATLMKKYAALGDRMKSLGLVGLISYGILNTLYYVTALSVLMIRFGVGAGAGMAGVTKAIVVAWSFSQVTKPLRFVLSIVISPFVDRWWRIGRKDDNNGKPDQ